MSTAATPVGTAFLLSSGAGLFCSVVACGSSPALGDDWQHNLLAVRVEGRILPAVVLPELVTKITLTA